jgi:hypothetical protein
MDDKKTWYPKLHDWSTLNVEAYKVIFNQSKERFEAHASTSEDITKKAQWIGISLFAFIGAFVSLKPNFTINTGLAVVLLLLLLCSLTFILFMLLPKEISLRGSPPKEMLPEEHYFDDDSCTVQQQEQRIYYSEIIRYQIKIDQIKNVIWWRALYFKIAFISAFLLLVLICLNTAISVARP